MRIDQALVERGLVKSRAQAQAAIRAGTVRVNDEPVLKASRKVSSDDVIEAEPEHPYVSRGGLKLASALDLFGISPEGWVCLDVGSSTGGFTDVLLRAGAKRVFSVDVGRDQLHVSLRSDDRVNVMEATDARTLTRQMISPPPQLVVCDASFIGLEKLLGAPLSLAAHDAQLAALFKPQFQVGPKHVGKGGMVTDEAATQAALNLFTDWLTQQGWAVLAIADSPIRGGDGNREFLVHARRSGVKSVD